MRLCGKRAISRPVFAAIWESSMLNNEPILMQNDGVLVGRERGEESEEEGNPRRGKNLLLDNIMIGIERETSSTTVPPQSIVVTCDMPSDLQHRISDRTRGL
jgi:hypothetical protein